MGTIIQHTALHGAWRRIMLSVAMALAFALGASAQQGLGIDNVFKRFGHAKGCTMVEMHDARLKGYKLKVYKSLTYKDLQPSIDPYLKGDRKNARKIREVVESGRIVSGYYMMAPLGNGVNRYILFSNPRGNSGAVIYIEGRLTPDDIMKLCYSSI